MGMIWRYSRRSSAARPEYLRSLLLLAPLALVLLCVACDDGGSSGTGGGVQGSFLPSATVPGTYSVRLRAGAATGDTVTVEVALFGPTTSSDIHFFAFDLLLSDPSVVQYVAGSAAAGGAFVPTGGQTTVAQAAQSGNAVIVGAGKTLGPGNAVGAGEHVVVSLRFRVLHVGSTTVTFATGSATAALDSTGAVIPSITFDTAAGAITGI